MSTDVALLVEQARAQVAAAGVDPSRGRGAEQLELQRVAQQFEAMLLTQMLREMRKAGEWAKDGDEGAQGLGLGTESFTEAIDAELGLHLARNKGIGLTSQLMQAFDRMAGVAPVAMTDGAVASLPVASATPAAAVSTGPIGGGAARVTSGYGWRSDPFTGVARFHKGVDLQAAYGQDVQAPAGGTVVFSGEQQGYGTTVVIAHPDGSRSRYAHLSAATVEAGTEVAAGQSVGRAGRSGRATGTHLHFEVTGPGGDPVAPDEWLNAL